MEYKPYKINSEFKKINILLGKNNSGKTQFMQFLIEDQQWNCNKIEDINLTSIYKIDLDTQNSSTIDNSVILEWMNKLGVPVSSSINLGKGAKRIFNIINQTLFIDKNTGIYLENPEAFIHPSIEYRLANFFLEMALKNSKTFFIESHSMFLVKKFLSLIAQNKVDQKYIGFYFFDNLSNEIIIEELKVEKNGQFTEHFPTDFFNVPFILSKEFLQSM